MEILEQSLGRVKAPAELWTRIDEGTAVGSLPAGGGTRDGRWRRRAPWRS